MGKDEITLDELIAKQLNGAEIIDVRNNREYEESHIEKSINIPEYEINKNFEKIISDKNKEIILYCSSGYRSLDAYKKLKKMGYTNVYNLFGGLDNY
jgi:phage shock protein E